MTYQPRTQGAVQRTGYKTGDYVLYRDADRFWTGQPGHTTVCKVKRMWVNSNTGETFYDLDVLSTGHVVIAHPNYMRLLPPADAMHDIDTAPLSDPDPGALSPAAVAWLRHAMRTDACQPKVTAG